MKNMCTYGREPCQLVLVHGGPGAAGEMAPVAKELSKDYGVLEPFQTRKTVKGQVNELRKQISENAGEPITLIGWSWGAWLSLIFTAVNPHLVKKLILVSSGPFEGKYTKKIMRTRLSRLSKEERKRVKELVKVLKAEKKGKDNLFRELGELISKADSYNPILHKEEAEVDFDIYDKVWDEAAKLRKTGKLLEYAKKAKCPTVVIHGDYDPHPFKGVKNPLSSAIKDIKFILLEECGHYPWLEKEAREEFYDVLREEIEG